MNAKFRIAFATLLSALTIAAGPALAATPASGLWGVDAEDNGMPGRGIQIDVQGSVVAVIVYAYHADGSPRWYLALGPLQDDTFVATLEEYAGGTAFGGTYSAARAAGSAGNITLRFTDSTHGEVTFPGEATKRISRAAFGAAAGTEFQPASGFWGIDAELNGKPGRGFQIDARTGIAVVTVAGYGADGSATWYHAAAPVAGQAFTAELLQFAGGTAFGRTYSPAHGIGSAGNIRLTFSSSTRGQVVLPGEGAKAVSRLSFGGGTPAFTMQQTLSDGAQRTTLAFSGLAMMTGNLGAQSFFPPGKVADYTGFQYLRDNDPDNMGHNTSFLTRIANNVINLLDDAQFARLRTLAMSQLSAIDLYGLRRYPLMKAFRRTLDGDIPAGSAGLNLTAVSNASRELYLLDGQIAFDRAALYAQIIRSLSAGQRAQLDAMKGKGWNSWPDISDAQVRPRMSGLPAGTSVAVMTYASDLFSWYAGSLEADVYFCPERHGTYFGGFFIKDAPAVGHEGYGIDEQLTATAGAALSDAAKGYVTATQAATMSALVDRQRNNLYAAGTRSIVAVRTEIAARLRELLVEGASSDAIRARVLELSATYGELDGENNHAYATTFAAVYRTLSADQLSRLAALRKSIMSGTYADGTPFDYSQSSTLYLYASPITDASVLAPYITDTDRFFAQP